MVVSLFPSELILDTCSVHYLRFAEYCIWMRERPLWSASLNAVIMKHCWGHTRVWDKSYISQGLRMWLRVVVPAGNKMDASCHTDQELWSDLIHLPFSPLCLFSSHLSGWKFMGGGNPRLSLPCSRCLCNLHTGLQSATEPLFIRLILKSTFCRPRKRLAKL